mmetsp:Transcript_11507/g.43174  ORF Transcript_11507/g.43174 Transcript_11507/m.43174 type:complete len:210 (-) Transcript_11507:868-1497(-)
MVTPALLKVNISQMEHGVLWKSIAALLKNFCSSIRVILHVVYGCIVPNLWIQVETCQKLFVQEGNSFAQLLFWQTLCVVLLEFNHGLPDTLLVEVTTRGSWWSCEHVDEQLITKILLLFSLGECGFVFWEDFLHVLCCLIPKVVLLESVVHFKNVVDTFHWNKKRSVVLRANLPKSVHVSRSTFLEQTQILVPKVPCIVVVSNMLNSKF